MIKTNSTVVFDKPKIFDRWLPEGIAGLAFRDDMFVYVEPRQSNKQYFLSNAHELFHCMLPDLEENQIFELEKNYGVALWNVVEKIRKRI